MNNRNHAIVRFCNLMGGTQAAALSLGVSPHTIHKYRRKIRNPSLKIAAKIEQLSKGRIKREDVVNWPDV